MILARIKLRRLAEPPDLVDAGGLLPDLEAHLDETALDEVEPALDQARRARAAGAA
ncbi:MAG TPA: hypothetical protein VIV59_06220 [Anaeromyxobacteraceae bacterium]